MWVEPGIYSWAPKGRQDNTHYNIYGARVMAKALAKAIGKAVPALKSHVRR
jgi:lysophospholipase L1-like esterase